MSSPPRVDLISDTATRPTAGMWDAMRSAPLGDEQKREDPTALALEAEVASLLGMERALFLPSATMANQIAIALHAGMGDEVLCHRTAHVFNHEGGFGSAISRAQHRPLDGPRGTYDVEALEAAWRVDDPHHPITKLIVVENTSNGGGGAVWPLELFHEVTGWARGKDVRVHIDGARLFHAAVASDVAPARWAERADTVQLCFSKGLGCPFGAVLGMPESLFARARRLKQGLGGALRQSGVIAAAMRYALEHNIDRLREDHENAARLAAGLAEHEGVTVEPVDTNLVYFHVEREGLDAPSFCAAMAERGIRMGPVGGTRVRACTHLDVSASDVEETLDGARAVLS
jgi:threonine aldolase